MFLNVRNHGTLSCSPRLSCSWKYLIPWLSLVLSDRRDREAKELQAQREAELREQKQLKFLVSTHCPAGRDDGCWCCVVLSGHLLLVDGSMHEMCTYWLVGVCVQFSWRHKNTIRQ